MSNKIPCPSVEYQSRNHCQCDFCCSRRALNAKKFGVSQLALHHLHGQSQNRCGCTYQDGLNQSTLGKTNGSSNFDPDYPAPVNQTALNASRGRNGVPLGNQYTISQCYGGGHQRPDMSGELSNEKRTEEDVMKELDQLERLLIVEHKERVAACLEADQLNKLRTTKKEPVPRALPLGFTASSATMQDGTSNGFGPRTEPGRMPSGGAGFSSGGDVAGRVTVQEAFELAHHCPVATVAQCDASHRLQDTINDLRMVAMDPTNPKNREALREVLRANRVEPLVSTATTTIPGANHAVEEAALQKTTRDNLGTEFKETLASIRTSQHHPQGAGVIWAPGNEKALKPLSKGITDKTMAAPLGHQEKTASSIYSPGGVRKKVTYVV